MTRRRAIPALATLLLVMLGWPGATGSARAVGINGLFLDSQAGDYIGQGQLLTMKKTSTTSITASGDATGVHLSFTDFDGSGHWWYMDFAAKTGRSLSVGTYSGATRFSDATHPALSVYGDGRGCNSSTGTFHVSEIDVDGTTINAFAAEFQQHCEGATPALYGEVRFQSSMGYRALSISPASISFGGIGTGRTSTTHTFTLKSNGTLSTTYASATLVGANATDFAIVVDTCTSAPVAAGASCQIGVTFTPGAIGTRTAALRVDEDTYRSKRDLPLTGDGLVNSSAVSWDAARAVAPTYSWNDSASLTSTTSSGVTKLHQLYTTDRVGGQWASDTGPYVGVYYVRSTDGAVTWSAPVRLNPTNIHAMRAAIAATGSTVYAVYVQTADTYSPPAGTPRVLYVKFSHTSGSGWGAAIRLSSTSGRVDYPAVSASGSDAYVVWTDSITGSIKSAASHDKGLTWTTSTAGVTTDGPSGERSGLPTVAATGSRAVVAWRGDSAGTLKARTTADAGATWSTTKTLETAMIGWAHSAARGSRLAVAWTNSTSVHVRVQASGTWETVREVATVTSPTKAFGPAVALQGTTAVAVSWADCASTSCTASQTRELVWSESSAGVMFTKRQKVGAVVASTRPNNDLPSIAWVTPTTRYVSWNGWTPDYSHYRIYLKVGTGTP